MNAIARYLLVFLLGWSGAVWSYSDLIYKTNKTSEKIEKLYDLIVKEGKSDLDHSALYLLMKRLKN